MGEEGVKEIWSRCPNAMHYLYSIGPVNPIDTACESS